MAIGIAKSIRRVLVISAYMNTVMEITFLIFNDNKEWVTYPADLFEPEK